MPYYGFNMLPMFGNQNVPPRMNDAELDFIAEHGFNFIRLPMDYRNWIHDFDYTNPDEKALALIDVYVDQILSRGLHANLNFHRAPGYCISRPDLEKHNLWRDTIAQDAFVSNWEMFARRYKDVPADKLSFDLLNEPCPLPGEWNVTRETHAAVMRRAIAAIRAITPSREIHLDGFCGGVSAIPELADTGTVHSTRGYQPHEISHYGASWITHITEWGRPAWPFVHKGKTWDRDALRDYYEPWREVERGGTRVFAGECGCYNKIPDAVARAWLGDLFGLFREFGWGYALWNFNGPFGIVNHGRPGAQYVNVNGMNVDMNLLGILKDNRVS